MVRRAVIFDVDGVLINSYRAHMLAWMRLGEQFGRPITEAEFVSTFGRRNHEIFHAIWPDIPDREIERLNTWKEAAYREIIARDFPAMDGARELLDALKAAGFALAVGSSGPIENVESALRGLGRAHLFDAIVSSTEVVHGKPDPEVFLKAAAKLAIEPPQCAVLEDSLAGLEAARRAGMVAIGLTGTFDRAPLAAKADLVVESLRDLAPEKIAAMIDAGVTADSGTTRPPFVAESSSHSTGGCGRGPPGP